MRWPDTSSAWTRPDKTRRLKSTREGSNALQIAGEQSTSHDGGPEVRFRDFRRRPNPGTNKFCVGSSDLTCDRTTAHLVPQLAPFDTPRWQLDIGTGSALSALKSHAIISQAIARDWIEASRVDVQSNHRTELRSLSTLKQNTEMLLTCHDTIRIAYGSTERFYYASFVPVPFHWNSKSSR